MPVGSSGKPASPMSAQAMCRTRLRLSHGEAIYRPGLVRVGRELMVRKHRPSRPRRRIGTVTGYEPMAFHLETERLSMQPWAVSGAEELSALWSERDTGTPGVERAREVIAERLARTAETATEAAR